MELNVNADRDVVKGILLNLLDNAAKYAPGKPVEVAWTRAAEGMVQVMVADRGPGLTPEQRRQAFTAFWRGDERLAANVGGFGLGLAIARMNAQGMGGDLWAEPRPGGGTIFRLSVKEAVNG